MASLSAPSRDQLIIAATKLVDAILEYRRPNQTRVSTVPKKEPEAAKPVFSVTNAADLLETDSDVLHLIDIVSDPVVWSLKRTLKKVGQALYDQCGSTSELRKIAEQIADRDPDQFSRRMSPIDSAWNGVGSGSDRWWS